MNLIHWWPPDDVALLIYCAGNVAVWMIVVPLMLEGWRYGRLRYRRRAMRKLIREYCEQDRQRDLRRRAQ